MEASAIAIVAGYLCGIGTDALPADLHKGLRRAERHLIRFLQDEIIKKFLGIKKSQDTVQLSHRKDASYVKQALKNFMDLARIGGYNQDTYFLADGQDVVSLLSDVSFSTGRILIDHSMSVWTYVWSLSVSNSFLFSGCSDGIIRVWCLQSWELK